MTRQIYVFFFGWPSERLTCSNQTQNRFFFNARKFKGNWNFGIYFTSTTKCLFYFYIKNTRLKLFCEVIFSYSEIYFQTNERYDELELYSFIAFTPRE